MFTQSLLTTALLAATYVAADQVDQVDQAVRTQVQNPSFYLTPNQLSKVGSEAESIALQNTVAANALYSWHATETAVSDNNIKAQGADYFDAFLTATATALPAYVTALPTSLQPYVSSLLVGEASLVATEVAPVVSSEMASASALVNSANSSSTTTAIGTLATSGIPSNSANATASQTGATPGSPTAPSNPPIPKSSSGAGRNGVLVAAGVVGVGLAGFMSLL